VREPAAGLIGRSRIDCCISHFYKRYLSVRVDYIGDAVRHPVGTKNSVSFSSGSVFEIAEEGERKLQLIGEYFLGRTIVRADAKNFRIFTVEFCDTSLVRGEFLRSATGECGGEKRQHHRVLTFEIGQRNFAAHGSGERKVRRHVSHFEGDGVAGLLGHYESAAGERQRGNGVKPHGKLLVPLRLT
jgi:hypothetical protein